MKAGLQRMALLLIVVFAAALLIAGCQRQTAGTAVSVTGGGSLPSIPNNTLSISVNVPNFGTNPQGTKVQDEWLKRMQEYLGVTLDITWNYTPWADFRNNEQVILASGQLPDVSTWSWGNAINQYGEDEVVLNIANYKDYLINYPEYIAGTPGQDAVAYNADGSMYMFWDGYVNEDNIQGSQSFTGFAYRFDLLKKHNLKPATTLDEYTALVAELHRLYPDKIAIINSGNGYPLFRGFVGIFHTWDTLYWNGKEFAYGPVEDNFRTMLKYINSLYAAGYIDPEFATASGDVVTQKAVTDRAMTCPTLWSGSVNTWNTTPTKAPETEWGLAFLPKNAQFGTPWKWGSEMPGTSLSTIRGFGIYISGKTRYPEYIVKMIDHQYNKEMVDLQNWGILGETYTKDASGKKTFTDVILNAENAGVALANYGISSSAAARSGICFTPQDFWPKTVMLNQEPWWGPNDGYTMNYYWVASDLYGGPESVSPYDRAPPVRLDADEATERARLINASDTIAREWAVRFITGEYNIDTQWTAYVQAIKNSIDDWDGTMAMLNANVIR
jgi:hypothetical protein